MSLGVDSEVAREFSRTRRNRTVLTSLVLAIGLVVVVLPDVASGTLGIGSAIFLGACTLAYYRIFNSRKRGEKDADSFPEVAKAIQTSRNESGGLETVVGYHIAPGGWLIKRSLLTFDYFPASSICWVYAENTRHSINFIPAYTERKLVVRLGSGRTLKQNYQKRTREEKLVLLRQIAPWALFGYSEQLDEAWRREREAVVAEVDRQRFMLAR